MNKNLNFKLFPTEWPKNEDDGKTFLLKFGGWQWELAKWSLDEQKFYIDDTYINEVNFIWAKLD